MAVIRRAFSNAALLMNSVNCSPATAAPSSMPFLEGGYDNPEDWETSVRIAKEFSPTFRGGELDEAMRGNIAEWRNIVTKRIEVKRHLRELGIDGARVRSAEQALLALYEHVQSGVSPACA